MRMIKLKCLRRRILVLAHAPLRRGQCQLVHRLVEYTPVPQRHCGISCLCMPHLPTSAYVRRAFMAAEYRKLIVIKMGSGADL